MKAKHKIYSIQLEGKSNDCNLLWRDAKCCIAVRSEIMDKEEERLMDQIFLDDAGTICWPCLSFPNNEHYAMLLHKQGIHTGLDFCAPGDMLLLWVPPIYKARACLTNLQPRQT